MSSAPQKVRLRVSPQVARILGKEAPRELQLSAARGALPMGGSDLLTALLFLYHRGDREIQHQALATATSLPATILQQVAGDPATPEQLLHFIAQVRLHDEYVMECVCANPSTPDATLTAVGRKAGPKIVSLLACNDERLLACPAIAEAIVANPHAERSLKFRLGWKEPSDAPHESEEQGTERGQDSESAENPQDAEPVEAEEEQEVEEQWEGEDCEDLLNLSKYQISLEMPVSEKIKMALTGDKEWRSIFLRDANKLVCSAVLKNPRITDGEVLAVARNRSASEELIRLILLNNEWVKNGEIKKALTVHPRTPLPKALRFMSVFTEKELKQLAKSRNVSQVIVNSARRMLMAKEKKR